MGDRHLNPRRGKTLTSVTQPGPRQPSPRYSQPGCAFAVMPAGSLAAPRISALITLRSSRFDRISFWSCVTGRGRGTGDGGQEKGGGEIQGNGTSASRIETRHRKERPSRRRGLSPRCAPERLVGLPGDPRAAPPRLVTNTRVPPVPSFARSHVCHVCHVRTFARSRVRTFVRRGQGRAGTSLMRVPYTTRPRAAEATNSGVRGWQGARGAGRLWRAVGPPALPTKTGRLVAQPTDEGPSIGAASTPALAAGIVGFGSSCPSGGREAGKRGGKHGEISAAGSRPGRRSLRPLEQNESPPRLPPEGRRTRARCCDLRGVCRGPRESTRAGGRRQAELRAPGVGQENQAGAGRGSRVPFIPVAAGSAERASGTRDRQARSDRLVHLRSSRRGFPGDTVAVG